MEINEKQIRKILEDQKKVWEFLTKLGDALGSDVYEALHLDNITDVIWEVYQIPKDSFPDFDPEEKREWGKYDFCTDGLVDVCGNYFNGDISLDDYINELEHWSEEFKHIYVNQLVEEKTNGKA